MRVYFRYSLQYLFILMGGGGYKIFFFFKISICSLNLSLEPQNKEPRYDNITKDEAPVCVFVWLLFSSWSKQKSAHIETQKLKVYEL